MALFKHRHAETESGQGAVPVASLDQLPPPDVADPAPAYTPSPVTGPARSAASPDLAGPSTSAVPAPPTLTAPATGAPVAPDAGAVEDERGAVRDDPPLVVPKTRTSATYSGVAVGLLVLVLVIIFIAQNLHDSRVHYLGLNFQLPIGLLILASAVAGGIIVLLVSAARVAQLRLMARRHRAGKPNR